MLSSSWHWLWGIRTWENLLVRLLYHRSLVAILWCPFFFLLNRWLFFFRDWMKAEGGWAPHSLNACGHAKQGYNGGKGSQKQFLCPVFKGWRLEQSHVHPGWPLEVRITHYTGMSCHSIFIFQAGLAQRMQMCLLTLLKGCKEFSVNENESLGILRRISRDIFHHTGFLQGSTLPVKTFKLCWQRKRNSKLVSCAAAT